MADVGLVKRGNRTSFTRKPLRELRVRNLNRDIPIQTRVPRTVNLSHATFADESEDLVGAEFVA